MGTLRNYSTYKTNMKLYLGLAFAAVMANAGVIDQAAKQFQENSGISAANQNKLETLAKQYVAQYGKMGQQEAKKVGIKFNFNQVMNNINRQYADAAANAIESAASDAENEFNNRKAAAQANPKFQRQVNQAKKASFNSVVNNIQAQLKKQLQNIPNAQAKKNLNALLDQGAKEAKDQLRKQGLLNKNIVKQAKAQIPKVEAQGALLQQQINEAIGNL